MGKYVISPEQSWAAMGGAAAPILVDVRRRAVFDSDGDMVPGAVWRDPARLDGFPGSLPAGRDVVVYCAHGHQLSQAAAGMLRAAGREARVMRGGIAAWREAALPTVDRKALPMLDTAAPSRWVTRRRPKIDRIACPWLISRFLDPAASFLFVEPDQVLAAAQEIGGTAFDIEGAPISHDGERCSFDTLLARSGIADPALAAGAEIVRGADTAQLELAPEAPGLLAMSLGISALCGEDDHAALAMGMVLYDALYAWRRKAADETHNWPAAA